MTNKDRTMPRMLEKEVARTTTNPGKPMPQNKDTEKYLYYTELNF